MNAFHFGQTVGEKLAAGPVVPPPQAQPGQPPRSWWQWASDKVLGSGVPTASNNIKSYVKQRNQALAEYGAPRPAPRVSTTKQVRR